MRVQMTRIETRHLHSRCALAMAASGDTQPVAMLAIVEKLARQIEREQMAWARPLVALLRAGGAGLGGDRERAAELCAVAVAGFEAAHMNLYAATARRRLGQLTGGAKGA